MDLHALFYLFYLKVIFILIQINSFNFPHYKTKRTQKRWDWVDPAALFIQSESWVWSCKRGLTENFHVWLSSLWTSWCREGIRNWLFLFYLNSIFTASGWVIHRVGRLTSFSLRHIFLINFFTIYQAIL